MIQTSSYAIPRLDLGMAFMEYVIRRTKMIATEVLAIQKTSRQASTFPKITRESLLKRAKTKRAMGGAYNRIDMTTVDDNYACQEEGLESVLGDDERVFFENDFDAEEQKANHIWQKLMMEYEIETAAAIFDVVAWAGAALFTDVSAVLPWSDPTARIIDDVIDGMDNVRTGTGTIANALILSKKSFNKLVKNNQILARFPGKETITRKNLEDNLDDIFGLEKLVVGGAVSDTAKEGQDFVGADIWSEGFAMVAKIANDGDAITEPGVGRTFLWTADSAELPVMEQYREEQSRGDVLRGRMNKVGKIIDVNFGHLLQIEV